MLIELKLHNFKNHKEREFEFPNRITYIIGDNGVGKTNILDAVYYLSFSKSYFGNIDTNNINYNADVFAIHGRYQETDISFNVSCIQRRGTPKSLKFDDKSYQRLSDHIGRIPLVMVSPYDNNLINDGSEIRRKFIDNVIMQFDKIYLEHLVRYNKALIQRNTLLKSFAERGYFDADMLSIWDEQLITSATEIHKYRHQFTNQFINPLKNYFNIISDSREAISVEYKSQLTDNNFEELLKQSIDKDKILKYTTVGIHKDDFNFLINDRALKTNASQGQQKSYIIALKLAQYQYIKEQTNKQPIILLDDIFANLDTLRISKLNQLILNDSFGQIIITNSHSVASGECGIINLSN